MNGPKLYRRIIISKKSILNESPNNILIKLILVKETGQLLKNKTVFLLYIVTHGLNPSIGKTEAADLCEFAVSLVCEMNFRSVMIS